MKEVFSISLINWIWIYLRSHFFCPPYLRSHFFVHLTLGHTFFYTLYYLSLSLSLSIYLYPFLFLSVLSHTILVPILLHLMQIYGRFVTIQPRSLNFSKVSYLRISFSFPLCFIALPIN